MVRLSTEIACPAAVITEIRPLVAPALAIDETGITILVPLPEVASIDLLRQNFTDIAPVNPVPVIVKLPPAESESVKVESSVIDGGEAVEVSNEVTPLRPIPEPLPTFPVGWLLIYAMK